MCVFVVVFFQAEDGIRDLVRSRGLGDVYKRQDDARDQGRAALGALGALVDRPDRARQPSHRLVHLTICLLYTSDAADERSSVDLGGRRIIKKKKRLKHRLTHTSTLPHHSTPEHVSRHRPLKD